MVGDRHGCSRDRELGVNNSAATLRVAEAAGELGVGERAIRDGVARGEIPHVRFGRLLRVPRWWIDEMRNGPRHSAEAA